VTVVTTPVDSGILTIRQKKRDNISVKSVPATLRIVPTLHSQIAEIFMPQPIRTLFLLSLCFSAGCTSSGPSSYAGQPTQANSADGPIYCYGTLADPDCYGEPQPGWEGRLIGSYEPKPAS